MNEAARKKILPVIVAVLLLQVSINTRSLMAQDIHFSQIDINPMLFNPAYAGFFDGRGRVGIAYRNQWATVMHPFQTMAASAEVALMRRHYQRDGLGLGLWAFRDREGSLGYGITAANAILSYFMTLDDGDLFISAAIEGGYAQSGYDPSNAVYGDIQEAPTLTSKSYPLVGAGLALFYQPSDVVSLKVGAAGRNLNRPSISLDGDANIKLERRLTAYTRMELRHWPGLSLLPMVAYQKQLQNNEIILGMDAKWYLSEGTNEQIAFSAGLYHRWLDAAILILTFEYNNYLFALSYDGNVSKLVPASRTVGAMEVEIVYRVASRSRVRHRAMPCPIM